MNIKKLRLFLLLLGILGAGFSTHVIAETPWRVSDTPVQQTQVNGVCVDRYGPTWVLRGAPDLTVEDSLQTGNDLPQKKIEPKLSNEIVSNYIGVNATRMPRSRQADYQPLEAVHLIDGDSQTCWMSRGQRRPDESPVWIRLDLPTPRSIEKIALVKRPILAPRPQFSYPVVAGGEQVGRGLCEMIRLETSVNGRDWLVVFDGAIDKSLERVEISFDSVLAKQIRFTAGPLGLCETMYALSFSEFEALDANGKNVALISNGVGITASSSDHGPGNEIEMHRWLWPIQSGLGAKWVRIGYHDDPINWHHVEKTKGTLALDPVADEAITEMTERGVNVVACLDFGNRLYSGPNERNLPQMWEWYWDLPKPPTSPEALAAWDRYVEFIVTKLKDRVQYFELWNEWDISLYWGEAPSLDNYLNIAKRTAAIVRRIAPDAILLSGSVTGGGFPFGCRSWSDDEWAKQSESNMYLKMFRELAPLVDYIGWHPYYNPDPNFLNDYPEDVKAFQKWLKSIGFSGRNMSTEWNVTARDAHLLDEDKGRFFGGPIQLSEMQKAKLTAQIFVQDSGLGLASFFCEIYNPYHAADLSLLRRSVDTDPVSSLQPQAAFYVVRNLATYLDQFEPETFDVLLNGIEPEKVRFFTFKTPNGKAVAVWTKGWPNEETVRLPVDLTAATSATYVAAFDPINGVEQKLSFDTTDGKTTVRGLKIGDAPTIIVFR